MNHELGLGPAIIHIANRRSHTGQRAGYRPKAFTQSGLEDLLEHGVLLGGGLPLAPLCLAAGGGTLPLALGAFHQELLL